MQLFNDVRDKAAQFVSENASTLLTAAGVVGTVGTAVLSGHASIKAYKILQAETDKRETAARINDEEVVKITPVEKAMLTGIHFVPPVLLGTFTIGSIIMANRISAQKAAALAAAYGMSQKHFEEYKKKVEEKLTGPKKKEIDEELSQERVNKTPGHEKIIIVNSDEQVCFDEPTGRYFKNTMEGIRQAVNSTNAEILHHDHASATYFYEELGLPSTTWSEMVGWNTDELLELEISTIMTPDDRPCISINFKTIPREDYASPKQY